MLQDYGEPPQPVYRLSRTGSKCYGMEFEGADAQTGVESYRCAVCLGPTTLAPRSQTIHPKLNSGIIRAGVCDKRRRHRRKCDSTQRLRSAVRTTRNDSGHLLIDCAPRIQMVRYRRERGWQTLIHGQTREVCQSFLPQWRPDGAVSAVQRGLWIS